GMADTCLICKGATVRERGIHPRRGAVMPMVVCHACGRYYFSMPEAEDVINGLSDDDRFTLSALTRRASVAGAPLELLRENVKDTIAAAPRPTLSGRIDRLLLLLSERAMGYLGPITVSNDRDFALVTARGPKGMNEIVLMAKHL